MRSVVGAIRAEARRHVCGGGRKEAALQFNHPAA